MSDYWATTGAFFLGCLVILYIGQRISGRNRHRFPLPPGPPGLPWVGNVIGVDASAPWLTYADWAKKYGNIIHSRLLGKHVIIINSEEIAKDLFENRSKNYSDRPYLITNDLYGLGFVTSLLPYCDRWRLHKRFFHQTFRPEMVPRFLPLQQERSCHFLRKLFDAPQELSDHVFEYTTSVVLKSAYDYDVKSRKDDIVDIVAGVLAIVAFTVRFDIAVILDAFPSVRYLPSWLPGMSFKKDMEMARASTKVYLQQPFDFSIRKLELSGGSDAPSMIQDGMQMMEERRTLSEQSWMEALKDTAGTAFLAASESSNSVLMTFFLMIMLNPEVQEKAQAQIDSVVGRSRLPETSDRPLLPFIDAIFRETLRYSPIAPLLLAHAAMDDDVYSGFHIPKGSLLLANVWSMAHDESRYPNPHAFIPERFLNEDGSLKPNDVEHITFGFGRRMCDGRHFADVTVWILIVKTLAVFKVLKPLDENGVEMMIEPKFSSGLIVHPLPFKYRIVPRFPDMDVAKLDELIGTSFA